MLREQMPWFLEAWVGFGVRGIIAREALDRFTELHALPLHCAARCLAASAVQLHLSAPEPGSLLTADSFHADAAAF